MRGPGRRCPGGTLGRSERAGLAAPANAAAFVGVVGWAAGPVGGDQHCPDEPVCAVSRASMVVAVLLALPDPVFLQARRGAQSVCRGVSFGTSPRAPAGCLTLPG